MTNLHPTMQPFVTSIPRINLASASAIRQGANLAFLALEMADIKHTGLFACVIRGHIAQCLPVREAVKMVHDQWKSGAKRELVEVFGGKLLRKILNQSI